MPADLAQLTLRRLLPRLQQQFAGHQHWKTFRQRLESHFQSLFAALYALYGTRYDFYYHLEALLTTAFHSLAERPAYLHDLDRNRLKQSDWYQRPQGLGAVAYIDLFAGNMAGLRQKMSYFRELGITYLHLMPPYAVPEPENDGGYAVSDYRRLAKQLGDIEELREFAHELSTNGISLALDFIFNHTSHEHEWAQRALQGDAEFQDFYLMFPDRTLPNAYERTLREIFPDEHPGAFTWHTDLQKWVWTTFHSYQWDLNYANMAVFVAMAQELLFLANLGAEVIRLDAVAFVWKEMGTPCENLPQAHTLIRAYNALCRIAAPAVAFKSEAIVHPDQVVEYIDPAECQLSYNPLVMALLWESLATRKPALLAQALARRYRLPAGTAWVNYVRVHDDIGWTFSDEDAAQLGINGYYHRQFLNQFYTGRFGGSFASGLPFQENPATGDCRICGTCASLAGLEQAIHQHESQAGEYAIRRIILLYSVILSLGGLPLLYLGDELGTQNDYAYAKNPEHAADSRWVHRVAMNWQAAEARNQAGTTTHSIFQRLLHMVRVRQNQPAFGAGELEVLSLSSPHILGYVRQNTAGRVLVLANFSEHLQTLTRNELRMYGLGYQFKDLVSEQDISAVQDLAILPYQVLWLVEGNR
ncbi:MAG TPA: amylosucrase [Anaerolineales bacterium]|nr:amylosucrase [Anaerolineales bacterium]